MTSHDAPEGFRTVPSGTEVLIRRETADDHRSAREVHTRAFGDSDRVPGLVEALRVAEAAWEPTSFVATVDGGAVGHVLLSTTRWDAPRRIVDVPSLSPLGVAARSAPVGLPRTGWAYAVGAKGEGDRTMVGVDRGTAKVRRMPRAVRERQMVDAAVQSFARLGYRAASMDQIAEVAGVSKPLVYLYLNSKDELFTTCIRREAKALVEAVQAGVATDAPADRQLWEGLTAFFAHTAEHPDGWSVLHHQARTHGEPFAAEVATMREELTAFVTHLIGDAAREARGNPDLPDREVAGLAQALVGAAESLADWANATPGVTAKEAAATLMNFAWAGLENLMKGDRWIPSAQRR